MVRLDWSRRSRSCGRTVIVSAAPCTGWATCWPGCTKKQEIIDRVRNAYWSALDQAGSASDGEARLRALVGQLERDYPSAAACLAEDLPALCVHLNYPLRLRKRLRSTNLLERSLGEVKRRTRVIGRFSLARPAASASAGQCSTSSSPAREVSVSQISRVVSSTNCALPSAQN